MVKTAARRIPLSRMSATVSSTMGCQLRLPKNTGKGCPANSSCREI
ncbi:Uncharacterised protein [Mycobacteroides abscessus subsp. abscessus]|nr:Uncharacterised protein [Mycobacteroides abscessus subsp. abscessus]SKV56257.1 Uncharacterised protein [Mycobacteroides abscessus subsp. abscessus]